MEHADDISPGRASEGRSGVWDACRAKGKPYFVHAEEEACLRTALRAAGFSVVRMEGVGLRDERGLLEALGKALRFPGYFGGNWDAFTDCMGDIANEGVPLALLWIDADTFLSRDLHSFVRAVHALLSVARDVDTVEDGFQFEIFFVAVHEAFRSAPAMTPPESPRSP